MSLLERRQNKRMPTLIMPLRAGEEEVRAGRHCLGDPSLLFDNDIHWWAFLEACYDKDSFEVTCVSYREKSRVWLWKARRGQWAPVYAVERDGKRFLRNVLTTSGLYCLVESRHATLPGGGLPKNFFTYELDGAAPLYLTPEKKAVHGPYELVFGGVLGPEYDTQPVDWED